MSVADGGTDCEDCSILPLKLIGFAIVRSWVLEMIGVRRCKESLER